MITLIFVLPSSFDAIPSLSIEEMDQLKCKNVNIIYCLKKCIIRNRLSYIYLFHVIQSECILIRMLILSRMYVCISRLYMYLSYYGFHRRNPTTFYWMNSLSVFVSYFFRNSTKKNHSTCSIISIYFHFDLVFFLSITTLNTFKFRWKTNPYANMFKSIYNLMNFGYLRNRNLFRFCFLNKSC